MKDADFREIAGIVADRDGFADIGRERRIDVAQALKPYAVPLHRARLGDRQQKKVEIVEAVWHAWQPASSAPRRMRRFFDLAMRTLIVVPDDECSERGVEFRKRQFRRGLRAALYQMAGQPGLKLGSDGSEKALDLAAPLRPADGRMDEFDPQRRRDLFEVDAREVAAMIDIEHVGNAADGP